MIPQKKVASGDVQAKHLFWCNGIPTERITWREVVTKILGEGFTACHTMVAFLNEA